MIKTSPADHSARGASLQTAPLFGAPHRAKETGKQPAHDRSARAATPSEATAIRFRFRTVKAWKYHGLEAGAQPAFGRIVSSGGRRRAHSVVYPFSSS